MKLRITHAGYMLGLIVSAFIIYFAFDYAANWRMSQGVYFGIGAEWFTLILPVIFYAWRIKSINKERKK